MISSSNSCTYHHFLNDPKVDFGAWNSHLMTEYKYTVCKYPDLPPRRPGFDPGSVHVGFLVDKVALGQVFPPSTSVFPCQFHSTGATLQGKTKRLIIFITGLHNKPQGCGASVASAAVPFTTKKYPDVRVIRSEVLTAVSRVMPPCGLADRY
jgi:hypothetical protein